jgi:hypothetical protein
MHYLFHWQLVVDEIFALNNHKEILMVYRKQVMPWFFLILVAFAFLIQQIQLNEFEHKLRLHRLNLIELIQLNVVAKTKQTNKYFLIGVFNFYTFK